MIEVLRLLHELEQSNSRFSTSYYVRHLDKLEPIPQFGHDIPDSPLSQKDWVWVAYTSNNDQPAAILIAAPVQGVAFLMRAYATDSAPSSIFVGLLRKVLADIHSRGYTKYITFLSTDRKEEAKLARLVIRAGGAKVGDCTLLAGDITKCLNY